jgi:glycosyltransferase involved in cell wall biosynthesis
MKVVFISRASPPTYTGAGRAVFNQARYLRDMGVETCILAARFNAKMPYSETIHGVPIRRFPFGSSYRWNTFVFHLRCAFWLLKNQQSYDLIQFSNMPNDWFPIFLIAKLLGKPVFVTMTLYGSDDLDSIKKSRLGFQKLFLLRRVQGILAISERLVEVSKKHVSDPNLISYLTRPVDNFIFHPLSSPEEKRILRGKFGVPMDSAVVLFSGSVIRRKGFDLLIEAWPQVLKSLPGARLYVAGPRTFDNEYGYTNQEFSDEIDLRIQTLGLQESVVFLGDRAEQVPELLRMADIFILPSRYEGLGNALIEAMATGLPCIICDQPWVPKHLIRHRETGFLCQPTPESIATGILTIFRNRDLAASMGTAAREVADRVYNPVTLAKRLIELYASSLR